eukprot:gene24838-31226_t
MDNRVHSVTTDGMTRVISGTGTASSSASNSNGDGGAVTAATFNQPFYAFVDSQARLYLSDYNNNKIRMLSQVVPSAVPTLQPSARPSYQQSSLSQIQSVVGTGIAASSGDQGPASAASLNMGNGVWCNTVSDMYVTETGGYRVRKIDGVSGIISTVVGSGVGSLVGGATSGVLVGNAGPATSATLRLTQQIVGNTGNSIYFADGGNNMLRNVNVANGIVDVFAGNGQIVPYVDGFAPTSTALDYPSGLCRDTSFAFYVSERTSSRVRKPTTAPSYYQYTLSQAMTVIGTGVSSSNGDGGFPTSTTLNGPNGVWADRAGTLYVSEKTGNKIRIVSTSGVVSSLAPNGYTTITGPKQLFMDTSNNMLYIALNALSVVVSVNLNTLFAVVVAGTSGTSSDTVSQAPSVTPSVKPSYYLNSLTSVAIIVGTGTAGGGGDGGQASSAYLLTPFGVTNSNGNVYVTESSGNRLRKVTSDGIIRTVGLSGVASSLSGPRQVCSISTTVILIADCANHRILSVDQNSGVSTIFAGSSGVSGSIGDSGSPTSATLYYPEGVFRVGVGTYISERGGNRIRRVINNSIITLFAGGGSSLTSNVAATSVLLSAPSQVFATGGTGVYCGLTGSYVVVNIDIASQILTTVAGTGVYGTSTATGAATSVPLTVPTGVYGDLNGNVYITDTGSATVKKLTNGVISTISGTGNVLSAVKTVIGTGVQGSDGDGGLASSATLYNPFGVWGSSDNSIYVTELNGNKLRKVTKNGEATGLSGPRQVHGDSSKVYISDCAAHRIIAVSQATSGTTILAGMTGVSGSIGDGGPATSATLYYPEGVFRSGTVTYISESYGNRIRAVTNGIISLFAGGGNGVTSGLPATSVSLPSPSQIFVDSVASSLYCGITSNSVVAKIDITSQIFTIFAGTNLYGSSLAIGPATSSPLAAPGGVYGDLSGNIFIADSQSRAVRMVTSGIITTISGTVPALLYGYTPSAAPSAAPSIAPSATPSFRPTLAFAALTMITTIAGNGYGDEDSGDGGAATSASLMTPYGLWANVNGELFISEQAGNAIRHVSVTGGISTLGFAADVIVGPRQLFGDTSQSLYIANFLNPDVLKYGLVDGNLDEVLSYQVVNRPEGVWGDLDGNVYVSDTYVSVVWKVSVNGDVSLFAGQVHHDDDTLYPPYPLQDNGQATATTITPNQLSGDSFCSNVLYVACTLENRIRTIDLNTGIIVTIAGGVTNTGDARIESSPATSVVLANPSGVWCDLNGNVYIAELLASRVSRVTNNILTTFAGSITPSQVPSTKPSSASPTQSPSAFPSSLNSLNQITTIMGTGAGTTSNGDGGPATSADMKQPLGIWSDSTGSQFVAEYGGNRIRNISSEVVHRVIPGSLSLLSPRQIWGNTDGTFYIADGQNGRIVWYRSPTVTNVIAGSITNAGFSRGDGGKATSAALNVPGGICRDTAGNVYISEFSGSRVRKVGTSSIITLFAGNGTLTIDNVPATSSLVFQPMQLFVDSVGTLYIAGNSDPRVRSIVLATGIITTIAGTGLSSSSSSTLPATSSSLKLPSGVFGALNGDLFVADATGFRVRRISSGQVMSTISGTGDAATSSLLSAGDGGAPTAAQLMFPYNVFVDTSGTVLVTDYTACKGMSSGDLGPASAAKVNVPAGIWGDTAFNYYVSEYSGSA